MAPEAAIGLEKEAANDILAAAGPHPVWPRCRGEHAKEERKTGTEYHAEHFWGPPTLVVGNYIERSCFPLCPKLATREFLCSKRPSPEACPSLLGWQRPTSCGRPGAARAPSLNAPNGTRRCSG